MAITNSGTLESTGGVLTIDGSTTTFSNSGTLEANGGELDLNSDTLTNTGTLKATNSSILELTGTAVANTRGTVTADARSSMGRDGGESRTNGSVGDAGTKKATGTNALHGMAITNSGTLESTGGVLTIDDRKTTFSNSVTLEANGGELDFSSDTLSNSGTLKATLNSTLELINTTVANTLTGVVTVDSGSTLDLDGGDRTEGRTSELQSHLDLVCRLLLHDINITNSGTLKST